MYCHWCCPVACESMCACLAVGTQGIAADTAALAVANTSTAAECGVLQSRGCAQGFAVEQLSPGSRQNEIASGCCCCFEWQPNGSTFYGVCMSGPCPLQHMVSAHLLHAACSSAIDSAHLDGDKHGPGCAGCCCTCTACVTCVLSWRSLAMCYTPLSKVLETLSE